MKSNINEKVVKILVKKAVKSNYNNFLYCHVLQGTLDKNTVLYLGTDKKNKINVRELQINYFKVGHVTSGENFSMSYTGMKNEELTFGTILSNVPLEIPKFSKLVVELVPVTDKVIQRTTSFILINWTNQLTVQVDSIESLTGDACEKTEKGKKYRVTLNILGKQNFSLNPDYLRFYCINDERDVLAGGLIEKCI